VTWGLLPGVSCVGVALPLDDLDGNSLRRDEISTASGMQMNLSSVVVLMGSGELARRNPASTVDHVPRVDCARRWDRVPSRG